MTNVAPLPIHDPESIDAIISENAAVLLLRSGDQKQALAAALGIEPSSLSHKLKGRRPWTATEIDSIARRYNVSHTALFKKLPGLDSNQEPIGSRLALVGSTITRAITPAIERDSIAPVSRIGA